MKKIATITFHASYNFGSCLQAYALQEYIKQLCKEKNIDIEYKIINFRKYIQMQMYDYRKANKGIKKIIKNIIFGKVLKKKYELFEQFIKQSLQITEKTYTTLEELKKESFNYDYYISGSDQIWNIKARDFDWAYMLNFVDNGKKISYAASLGPKMTSKSKEEENTIRELLNKYDCISVREQMSSDVAKNYTTKEININIDPTMLLTAKDWEKIILDKPLYDKEDYLLFYTLKMSKERVKAVKKIAKELNLKVIVMTPFLKYDILGNFIKMYNTGPKEFLNLIKNAKLIISSSFHGTVFSILMNKPFYSLDGLKDGRINTILKGTNLEDRDIVIDKDLNINLKKAYDINFEYANKYIKKEREKSKEYLINALDL